MQSSISDPSMVPSAAPRLKAIPALVVAIAANPACSSIRAEPPSQAFGRMKPAPGRCIARNAAARFGVAEVSMRLILNESVEAELALPPGEGGCSSATVQRFSRESEGGHL